MILYVNSCVRSDSRTDRIARALLEKLAEPYDELYLPNETIQPLNESRLIRRTQLIEQGDFSDPIFKYARDFASADIIVISAPFWDISFPAMLKVYFENVYVTGLVTKYGSDGTPHGLCRAKKLYYVTTAGGKFTPDYGYCCVKELAQAHFGIKETKLIMAQMLDVDFSNAESIVQAAIDSIEL